MATVSLAGVRKVYRGGVAAVKDVTLGIRPEHLGIGTGAAPEGALHGRVYLVELMGSESWVTVDVKGEHLIARAPADFAARTGETVWLHCDAQRLQRFDTASGRRL